MDAPPNRFFPSSSPTNARRFLSHAINGARRLRFHSHGASPSPIKSTTHCSLLSFTSPPNLLLLLLVKQPHAAATSCSLSCRFGKSKPPRHQQVHRRVPCNLLRQTPASDSPLIRAPSLLRCSLCVALILAAHCPRRIPLRAATAKPHRSPPLLKCLVVGVLRRAFTLHAPAAPSTFCRRNIAIRQGLLWPEPSPAVRCHYRNKNTRQRLCRVLYLTKRVRRTVHRQSLLYQMLVPFSGVQHCVRTGGIALCRGVNGLWHRAGRSATWYRGWRSLPDGRTVRAYRPDGPRVRRGGKGRRRCLYLAPGRDPIGEERS
jgi:hypothetical protein